ncbi:MAG: hypothetical protein ACR2IK_14595 [Chloroflexota bacterium]
MGVLLKSGLFALLLGSDGVAKGTHLRNAFGTLCRQSGRHDKGQRLRKPTPDKTIDLRLFGVDKGDGFDFFVLVCAQDGTRDGSRDAQVGS